MLSFLGGSHRGDVTVQLCKVVSKRWYDESKYHSGKGGIMGGSGRWLWHGEIYSGILLFVTFFFIQSFLVFNTSSGSFSWKVGEK